MATAAIHRGVSPGPKKLGIAPWKNGDVTTKNWDFTHFKMSVDPPYIAGGWLHHHVKVRFLGGISPHFWGRKCSRQLFIHHCSGGWSHLKNATNSPSAPKFGALTSGLTDLAMTWAKREGSPLLSRKSMKPWCFTPLVVDHFPNRVCPWICHGFSRSFCMFTVTLGYPVVGLEPQMSSWAKVDLQLHRGGVITPNTINRFIDK